MNIFEPSFLFMVIWFVVTVILFDALVHSDILFSGSDSNLNLQEMSRQWYLNFIKKLQKDEKQRKKQFFSLD